MSLDQLFVFLSWALGVNLAVYALTAVALLALREWMANYHARAFNVPAGRMREISVLFLSAHKQIIINFFFVPWVAVSLMR